MKVLQVQPKLSNAAVKTDLAAVSRKKITGNVSKAQEASNMVKQVSRKCSRGAVHNKKTKRKNFLSPLLYILCPACIVEALCILANVKFGIKI